MYHLLSALTGLMHGAVKHLVMLSHRRISHKTELTVTETIQKQEGSNVCPTGASVSAMTKGAMVFF